jgi:hypothetical protein
MIAAASLFAVIGVTYLAVALLKKYLPEGGIRNSTDEIGNRVLLASADFADEHLDEQWSALNESDLMVVDNKVICNHSEQQLLSPTLDNNFTKYVSLFVPEVSIGSESSLPTIEIYGQDRQGHTLEKVTFESIAEPGLYSHRFAYDHVFIERFVFSFRALDASISVDYILIYALQ